MGTGAGNWPAVAGLGESRAMACWDDQATAALRCAVLQVGPQTSWVDAMDMSTGAAVAVSTGSSSYDHVSLARVDEQTTVVCYKGSR